MAAPSIGVLALQGDVREHCRTLADLGANPSEVRRAAELAEVEGLVIPGGESTAMSVLLGSSDLLAPLRHRLQQGMPTLGTCAGMILLANRIEGGEEPVLGLLDATVRRNARGRQMESHEAEVQIPAIGDEPLHGVFIRSPVLSRTGPGVEVLARDEHGNAIAVRQGRVLATAFHPELTPDRRLHRLLLAALEA